MRKTNTEASLDAQICVECDIPGVIFRIEAGSGRWTLASELSIL